MPIEPVAPVTSTPYPQPGPAPTSETQKSTTPAIQPDRVAQTRAAVFDPSAMARSLQQHAQTLSTAATATVGRGLQAASKAIPEVFDVATARVAGLAGVVLSMPGDVPHDAAHGYGVAASRAAGSTMLQARRDARTLAKAMPVGVAVQTVNCKKPPQPQLTATRNAFAGTLQNNYKDGAKAEFIKHVARTQPTELSRLGFSQSEIADMARNARPPKGVEVHHRMPIECGGTNDFSNLTLVRKDVHAPLTEAQLAATKGLQYGESRQVELLMTERGAMYPNSPNALNQPFNNPMVETPK